MFWFTKMKNVRLQMFKLCLLGQRCIYVGQLEIWYGKRLCNHASHLTSLDYHSMARHCSICFWACSVRFGLQSLKGEGTCFQYCSKNFAIRRVSPESQTASAPLTSWFHSSHKNYMHMYFKSIRLFFVSGN